MNEYKQLAKRIKTEELKRFYLFYGGDDYMKNAYAQMIRDRCVPIGARDMNVDAFDGMRFSADDVFSRCETVPFLADKRVVIVKNSGLFEAKKTSGGESDSANDKPKTQKTVTEADKTEKYIKKIPDTAVIIFIEDKADKRKTLYKTAASVGECIEFKELSDEDAAAWVTERASGLGSSISKADAAYFVSITAGDMGQRYLELKKLACYCGAEITKRDISELVVKTTEAGIFSLVDAIGDKDLKTALEIYGGFMTRKESPFMILAMMIRQFRLIMGVLDFKNRGRPLANAEKAFGLYGFAAKKIDKQSRNFDQKTLMQALRDCLELDMNIKKGIITDTLGVQMLIIKYASR